MIDAGVGRIVNYHVGDNSDERLKGNHATVLPAIIVRVWDDGKVNLKVFTDGREDVWVTSVERGLEADQWWHPLDKG